MTKQLLATSILTITGLLGTVVSSVHALSSPGISFTSVGTDADNGSFMIGYRFTVGANDIIVDQLGYFDLGRDGLLTSHNVGIFRETGQSLVISAIVPSGTGANLDGFFRYVPVALTTLTANTTYRIAGLSLTGSDRYSFNNGGFTVDPAITYNSAVELNTNTFSFPTTVTTFLSNGYSGANFTFTDATPVPFEFNPALGLGVFGAAFAIKQKLKKKSEIK